MARQPKRVCWMCAAALAAFGLGMVATVAPAQDMDQEIIDMVIDALQSDDPEMQTGAIAIVREIPGAAVTKALAQELPKLPTTAQVQLLSALADRDDAAALPAVVEASQSEDEAVRVAALKALGELGDTSSVPLLAKRAASTRGAEQKAARESLYRLRGEPIDQAIARAIPGADSRVKVELISAIGERNIPGAVEVLLTTAKDDDRRVRVESLRVLKVVARPADMPALVNLLLELPTEADRREAEKTLAAVAHKIEEENRQAAAVLAVLPNVKEVEKRASLLRVLGRIGDGSALPTLRTALNSREEDIKDAAIRALSDWPTAAPVADLVKVAQTADNQKHKILALRGFVRLLGMEGSDLSAEKKVELYRKAMELAPNALEKKRVLSGLSATKSLPALNLAVEYLDDLALHLEAESAAVQIAQGIYGAHPQRTKEVMQQVVDATKHDGIRGQAQQVIEQIERFDDYLVAWQISGPYMQSNTEAGELFDVEFAPEKQGQEADWRIVAPGSGERPWLIELDKQPELAGDNRVAYLRTRVWSPEEQKAQLEIGSDDGVKVWLNGQIVHANNTTRAVTPGQDKAQVTLKEGWNPLLVKLTQGGGQWALAARLRNPEGGELEGLKVEP